MMNKKALMTRVLQGLLGIMTLGYPLLVYLGLTLFSVKLIAALMLGVFILRGIMVKAHLHFLQPLTLPVTLCGITLATGSLVLDNNQALLLYPVLVNIALLGLFSWSLIRPPSIIECFARLTTKQLPCAAIGYTRKVTFIWCLFFIINGTIAGFTALYGSLSQWTLYNGLLSYLLMGLLFGVEWVYRKWVLKV